MWYNCLENNWRKAMIKPFIKWPGGKSSELNIIHQHLPAQINNYIEPFLGGGACFLSLDPKMYQSAYLNDISYELISIYSYIQNKNELFNTYLQEIWRFWNYFGAFADNNYDILRKIYTSYKEDSVSKAELKELVRKFVLLRINEIQMGIPQHLSIDKKAFINQLGKSIYSKLTTIKNNEDKRGNLPEEDYKKNFEAGIKAAVYTYNRYLYNNRDQLNISPELHIALFFYLREYCYSSMFRYNRNKEFNVPYGGISYNSKDFMSKIEYIWSKELGEVLKGVYLSHLDFEEFFKVIQLGKQDFIFVDPPYDTEFSTYANHEFGLHDQQRLANYLIDDCPARFMIIIKNTEFIYNLYNRPGIRIIGFDKEYQVSFMDRNEKAVNHLLIMNY